MGKGQRSRIARADEMAEKKIKAKKDARRAKFIKIVSIVCVIAIVAGIASIIVVNTVQENNRTNGTYLNRDIALTSTNYKVTDGMLMYYFNNIYSNFVNNNSAYLSSYGLDTSKSLKEQNCPTAGADGDTQTWFEYFLDAAKTQVNQILVLAEAAKDAGVKLTEDETKEIKTTVDGVKASDIVPGMKQKDLTTCLEIAKLADKYQAEINNGIKPTDADIEKYYKDNKNNYDVCSYRLYTFNYKAEDAEEDDAATLTKDEAKKYADELAATGSEDKFLDWLKNYFTNTLKVEKDNLQSELDGTKSENITYAEGSAGSDFTFDAKTKAGDIKLVEDADNNAYKVFLMLSPAHRIEDTTRTVRHILFNADSEDKTADAEAKKKADDILAKYNKNKTEDNFITLAKENSEDGSASDGGLIENFTKNSVVAEFGDWSFDAARKAGDTAIVKSTYGYHVMYFVSVGDAEWKVNATADYKSAEYQKKYDAFAEKFTVTANDKNIEKIADYIK